METRENYTETNKKIINDDNSYFEHFACGQPKSEHDNILRAFNIAIRTREFEIGLYWRRANYFWIFVSVIFVGWYTVSYLGCVPFFIKALLVEMGLVVSFCWYCVNRGSKYWQENWERNIQYLSKQLNTPIFGMIAYPQNPTYKLMKSFPYSVSKSNQVVSLVITAFWILLGGYQVYEEICQKTACCIALCYVIFLIIVGATILFIHCSTKSFVCKEMKHNAKNTIKWDSPMFYNY